MKYILNILKRKSGNKAVLFREKDKYLEDKEFQYILWLDRIYQKINTIPGHIIEIGVARGRNAIIFGHLIKMNGDHMVRNYYGFDTFYGYSKSDVVLDPHLSESEWKNTDKEFVENRLKSLLLHKICYVFEGDIRDAGPKFIDAGHAGFAPDRLKVALLYIDSNAYGAAKFSMDFFRERMSPGGIVCIDEKKQGGETRALEEFTTENGFQLMRDPGPFGIPAYTVACNRQT